MAEFVDNLLKIRQVWSHGLYSCIVENFQVCLKALETATESLKMAFLDKMLKECGLHYSDRMRKKRSHTICAKKRMGQLYQWLPRLQAEGSGMMPLDPAKLLFRWENRLQLPGRLQVTGDGFLGRLSFLLQVLDLNATKPNFEDSRHALRSRNNKSHFQQSHRKRRSTGNLQGHQSVLAS
jgi:hypothetical protein